MPPHLLNPLVPPPLPDRKASAPGAQGSRTALVYWPAVAAAALLSLFILTGLLAWLASHPGSRSPAPSAHAVPANETKSAALREVARASLPHETPAVATVPVAASEKSAPAPMAVKESAPAPPMVVLVDRTALPAPPAAPEREEAKAEAAAVPPELPEPEEPALMPAKQPPPAAAPVCVAERYGTSVDFLNNPQVATRQARTQAKLVFLLHVSGNFEDNCFT